MEAFLQDELIKDISKIHRKTKIYLNEKCKPLAISSGQIAFIMIACEKGSLPQNQFCTLLDMDKSTVAKMIQKLEKENLVYRLANENDSRSILVSPTPRAQAIYPVLRQIGSQWVAEITGDLSAVEKAVFYAILEKINQNIDQRQKAKPLI